MTSAFQSQMVSVSNAHKNSRGKLEHRVNISQRFSWLLLNSLIGYFSIRTVFDL